MIKITNYQPGKKGRNKNQSDCEKVDAIESSSKS